MSWSNFLPFAAGFLKGFVEEYTRPEPADTTSFTDCYGFRRHMAALAEATGVRLATLHERRASFAFSFRHKQYFASAVLVRDKISVAVFSKIELPTSGIPAELVRAVKGLNAKLPRCRRSAAGFAHGGRTPRYGDEAAPGKGRLPGVGRSGRPEDYSGKQSSASWGDRPCRTMKRLMN